MKLGKILLAILILSLTLIIHPAYTNADKTVSINPTLDFQALILLTPGSSSTVNVKAKGDVDLTTVLCLGGGTLTVGLTKDDTDKELVSMFIIGFPADPSFIPNFAITPASISASTTMGGFGMVFILSGVYSGAKPPYEYTLSLKLTPPAK